MGAKDWFICYADTDVATVIATKPSLDRTATFELVQRLFPNRPVQAEPDGTLDNANTPEDMVYAAAWPGAAMVCTTEVAIDRPSQIHPRFLAEGAGRTVYVHAMHSVVDWFAYAAWTPDGQLRRALSVSSDQEVIEDIGERLAFEEPFWAGQFPATDYDDDYPLPFHPLELSEAALHNLFGFVFEGYTGMDYSQSVDPSDIALAGYRLGSPAGRRRWFSHR